MTKQEFIERLKNQLKNESYETVCQTLTYYEEMIDDLMEDGIDEKEAVSKLGSMKEILANIKGVDVVEIKKLNKSTSVVISALLILGFPLWAALLSAGACLLLSFYIVIWCVPLVTLSLGIVSFCCFVIGLFGSFLLFMDSVSLGITQLGVSALYGACSILGIYLTYITYGKILNYSKEVSSSVKKWLLDLLRKVGIVC